jgi:tRNA1(Val) A37 N6-methylase TrmN6
MFNLDNLLKKDERIDQLYSNDIKVIQNPNVFSFSLDAVLLAHFAKLPLKSTSRIVDLCAGNGAVGLFMSHKTKGKIVEIELQSKLADMAIRSVQLNKLQEKVTVINDDLLKTYNYLEKDSVDVITCNPPYFPNLQNSKKNPNRYLAIARHEITTNLSDIFEIASGLLKTNAKIFLVYRPDRMIELISEMTKHNIMPKTFQFVYPREGKNANILLVEGIKNGHNGGTKVLNPIYTYKKQSSEYSNDIRTILYGK